MRRDLNSGLDKRTETQRGKDSEMKIPKRKKVNDNCLEPGFASIRQTSLTCENVFSRNCMDLLFDKQ
jgi:hypothetical protein